MFYLLLLTLTPGQPPAYTELATFRDGKACYHEAKARESNVVCVSADALARALKNGAKLHKRRSGL